VNIWTCDDRALLTAELPGVDPAKLEVSVQNDIVTVRGSRDEEALPEGHEYLRRERGTGGFARSFALPFHVDANQVRAHYQKGILQLALPRAEEDKPRKIEVQGA
jgi:HSP20 family protein